MGPPKCEKCRKKMKVLFNTSFYCDCLDKKFEEEWQELEDTKPGIFDLFDLSLDD